MEQHGERPAGCPDEIGELALENLMNRVTKWDRRFLALAELISTWSLDPSTQVGAVITDNLVIVSQGFNGLPMGIEDTPERLHDRALKYRMIVHAECNAILFARRSLVGCTLYTYPFMPCSVCAAMVIQTGITRVVSLQNNNPRWLDHFQLTQELFKEANIALELRPSNPQGETSDASI